MSDIVKKQLENVAYADLSNFDPATNTYIIPKYSKPSYEIGKEYIVKIPQELVNNHTSVLASNWNNGSAPGAQYLRISVSKTYSKYIYVDSLQHDMETGKDIIATWSGWLNADSLTQLAVL